MILATGKKYADLLSKKIVKAFVVPMMLAQTHANLFIIFILVHVAFPEHREYMRANGHRLTKQNNANLEPLNNIICHY